MLLRDRLFKVVLVDVVVPDLFLDLILSSSLRRVSKSSVVGMTMLKIRVLMEDDTLQAEMLNALQVVLVFFLTLLFSGYLLKFGYRVEVAFIGIDWFAKQEAVTSLNTRELATHIGEVVINKCFCTRRNPISISAAAIYLASQLEDKRITQAEICKVTGFTEVTLRKVYKELLENWDDLLPSNYTPAIPPEKAFPTVNFFRTFFNTQN